METIIVWNVVLSVALKRKELNVAFSFHYQMHLDDFCTFLLLHSVTHRKVTFLNAMMALQNNFFPVRCGDGDYERGYKSKGPILRTLRKSAKEAC